MGQNLTRTGTLVTAVCIIAAPIVTADDRWHLHDEGRRDRLGEAAARMTVVQSTTTMSLPTVTQFALYVEALARR